MPMCGLRSGCSPCGKARFLRSENHFGMGENLWLKSRVRSAGNAYSTRVYLARRVNIRRTCGQMWFFLRFLTAPHTFGEYLPRRAQEIRLAIEDRHLQTIICLSHRFTWTITQLRESTVALPRQWLRSSSIDSQIQRASMEKGGSRDSF